MKTKRVKDQFALQLEAQEVFQLPRLMAPPVRDRQSLIQHELAGAAPLGVVSKCERDVDGKAIGDLYHLSDGKKYLLTTQEKFDAASVPDVAGVLHKSSDNGGTEWLNHKELDGYREDWSCERLDARRERVTLSWRDALRFREASTGKDGFRRPQLGALYSIGAHWSLSNEVSTIVMPTGTGKTETMLAATVAFQCKCVLVVTPSNAVRDQVADKFIGLGKLREFDLLDDKALNPVVGIIRRRPRTADDLMPFRRCNVIVATVSAIAQGSAEPLAPKVAELCSHLFIDEAHHVTARTWRQLREAFAGKPVLQFTATPFREDGERVDGKIIYSYPLARAQRDGFFKPIHFNGVFEEDSQRENEALAKAAVARLRDDCAAGRDHVLMARCSNKIRAAEIHRIYRSLAPDLNPLLIHSDVTKAKDRIAALRTGLSRIVVCVNMLAEGFDLPTLKIAAVHDKHKSLGVLMQFAGRFTRSAGEATPIGDATVFANVADPDVAESLRHLFVEDADWDSLLADVSLDRIEREQRIIEFIRSGRRMLAEAGETGTPTVALGAIRPKESAVIYEATAFDPDRFIQAKQPNEEVVDVWKFENPALLVFVVAATDRATWTRAKSIEDRVWHLYIAYFNRAHQLLFLHCSDAESLCGELATAVSTGTARRLEGGLPFKMFGGINRLTLHQVGIKKHGARRAVSYTQMSGTDVKPGLTQAELTNSSKAMIAGTGFERGGRVAVGGSRKGKVWSRQSGVLLEFVEWCDRVAVKVRDSSIDPEAVIRDGLKPEPVESFPATPILRIEWGERFLGSGAMSSVLVFGSSEYTLLECDIEIRELSPDGSLKFAIITMDGKEFGWQYLLSKDGFSITKLFPEQAAVRRGRTTTHLEDFLNEDPPALLFVDGSEIIGAELYRPTPFGGEYAPEQLIVKDWSGCDIRTESIWKNGLRRANTVQGRAVEFCKADGYDLIFNDDDAGEIADLVCFKREGAGFIIRFVHCKFSKSSNSGARVGDLTEVASQASRSVRWTGRVEELVKQMRRRSKKLNGKDTRFVIGGITMLNGYERLGAAVRPSIEIVAVQPGVSKKSITSDQKTILGAADGYLRQTVEVSLTTWCSE